MRYNHLDAPDYLLYIFNICVGIFSVGVGIFALFQWQVIAGILLIVAGAFMVTGVIRIFSGS